MKIEVPESIGRLIERRVRSGKYRTNRDVLIAAMLQLDEHDRIVGASESELTARYPQIKVKIARGAREAEEGKLSDGEAVFADLQRANPVQAKPAAARRTKTG